MVNRYFQFSNIKFKKKKTRSYTISTWFCYEIFHLLKYRFFLTKCEIVEWCSAYFVALLSHWKPSRSSFVLRNESKDQRQKLGGVAIESCQKATCAVENIVEFHDFLIVLYFLSWARHFSDDEWEIVYESFSRLKVSIWSWWENCS